MGAAQLLAAVYEQPEDLSLRSIYADWLQHRGDPLGELIALQLARDERPPCARERQLIETQGARMVAPISSLLAGRLRFKRGLLSSCCCRRGPASPAQLNSPFWRTVESLQIEPVRSDRAPIPCDVWGRAPLPALRSAFGLHLPDLLAQGGLVPQARGLSTIGVAGWQDPKTWEQLLGVLGEATNLSKLDLLDCRFPQWQYALHVLFESELISKVGRFAIHRPWMWETEFDWLFEHLPPTCTELELEVDGLVFWMDRAPGYARWAVELDLRRTDPVRLCRYLSLIESVSIHRRVRARVGAFRRRRVLGILFEFAKSRGLRVELIE